MARRYKKKNDIKGFLAIIVLCLFFLAPYLKMIFIGLLIVIFLVLAFFLYTKISSNNISNNNFSLEEGIRRYRVYEKNKQQDKAIIKNYNQSNFNNTSHKIIHSKSSYSYIPKQQINKEKSNIRKGKEYEEQISQYYQKMGYQVIEHGKQFGKKDKGIDLIATKENETLLIQCKNWENSIVKQKHLKEFIGNCYLYLEKHPYNNQFIKKVFITSSEKEDYGVKKFLQENNRSLEYIIIPYKNI